MANNSRDFYIKQLSQSYKYFVKISKTKWVLPLQQNMHDWNSLLPQFNNNAMDIRTKIISLRPTGIYEYVNANRAGIIYAFYIIIDRFFFCDNVSQSDTRKITNGKKEVRKNLSMKK